MPIEIDWATDERETILITVTEPWGWDDITTLLEQTPAFLEGAASAKVSVVLDASEVTNIDRQSFTRMQEIAEHEGFFHHPCYGHMIVAGNNRVIDLTARVFATLFPLEAHTITFKDTLAEALASSDVQA